MSNAAVGSEQSHTSYGSPFFISTPILDKTRGKQINQKKSLLTIS